MCQPVRCFTCGKVLGNKYEFYKKLKEDNVPAEEIWKTLGLSRYCCKTIMLSSIDLVEKYLKYSSKGIESGTSVKGAEPPNVIIL